MKKQRLVDFLGLILLSQSDLISLHKHAIQWFHMNVCTQHTKWTLKKIENTFNGTFAD